MGKIKESHIVTKRNLLNELRANSMTLQELRFFSIYLSKINPNDISTRIVRFPIDDFQSIMELGRINIAYLKTVTNSLLGKVINVPNERGGYSGFQIFKECTVDQDKYGEWYVEIDAHDKALPLMFEFKNQFFSYELWNALRLKSSNQLRMYEILKQYENLDYRIISVEELRLLLGINKNEYALFNNFRKSVLDVCQSALEENTDISFTYEPYGKRGSGGKILYLKFNIFKNQKYVDQLSLKKFIEQNKFEYTEDTSNLRYDERISFFMEACNNEFSRNELIVIYDILLDKISHDKTKDDIWIFNYLRYKYNELEMRSEKTNIKSKFSYLKKMIKADEGVHLAI